jgi:Protein of unknown function (DUF3662)
MAAITRDSAQQFLVRWSELAGRGIARLRRDDPVLVDPYLIGRAIAEVIRTCTVRSALGKPLLWNEYRVVLARADFEPLRALHAPLERDLKEVLSREAGERKAELVGELRVTIVADEADELRAGQGVIRPAFVPTEKLAAPSLGAMTVRMDAVVVHGTIDADATVADHEPEATDSTVHVTDLAEEPSPAYVLEWSHGKAPVPVGATVIVGRPHADAPALFIPLQGASARINKQHFALTAGPASVRIQRLPSANPVHVDGQPLPAGAELEVTPPVEISLSRGDLMVVLAGRPR